MLAPTLRNGPAGMVVNPVSGRVVVIPLHQLEAQELVLACRVSDLITRGLLVVV